MTIRYVLHPSSNFSPNYNSVTGALADAVSGDEIHIHNSNIDALLVIRFYIDNSQVVLAFNENQNLGFDQVLNNSSANFLKSTNNIYYNAGSVMIGPESVFYTTSVAAFNEAFKLKVHGGAKFQAGNVVVGTATETGSNFSEHLRIDTYGNLRIGLTNQTLLTVDSSSGNLAVTGKSVLNNDVTATARLNVSGMTTLLGDTTAVARFNVSGESTLLGNATLVSQLNVSGETTLLGNTTAVARFNVSGESTLLGNTTAVARFNVSGETTLLGNTTLVSQLNVSGMTTLLGNTTAVARFNVSGESTLLGNTTLVSQLNVSGESTLLGNTTLVSQLNVSGKSTLQGDVTMLSQFNLVGDITYSGNMIKNGFTMMSWFDNSIASQPGGTSIIPTASQDYYGCYIDVNFSSSKVYSYIMQSVSGSNILKWTIAGSNDRNTWYLLDSPESNTGSNYNTSGPFRDTAFTYVRFIIRKIDFHYNVLCQRFCLYNELGNKINISLYDTSSWAASKGIVYYQGNWSNPVNSDFPNTMYLGSQDYDTYNNGWDGSYTGSQYTTIIPNGTIVVAPNIPGQARMYNLAEIGIGISAPTNMLSVSGTTLLNGAVSMTTTLNVSGETTLLGNATAVGRLNVSGESTLLGNMTAVARFNVSGESTLLGNTTLVSQLNVSGMTTLLGNTTAVARFNVSGESTLLGNTTLVSQLNVSGETTLLGNTTAVARFNVSGESTLLGNTTLLSQLNVSGKTTLEGAVTANSTVNINDTVTVLKKVQLYTFSHGNGGTAGTNYYAGGGGAGGVIVRQNGTIINPVSIATKGDDSSSGNGGNGGIGFGAGGGGGNANVVSVSGSTSTIAGEWIQFDLGSAKVIQTYGLGNWGMDKEIGSWTLAGSTDNSSWYTIDTQTQVTPAHYAFTTYTSAGTYASSSYRYIRLIVQGLKQQPYYYGSTLQFTFYLRDSANNFLQTSPSNTATYSENLGNTTGYFYMSSSTSDVYPNSPGAGPSGAGYYYGTNNTYTGPISTTIYSAGGTTNTITSLSGGSGANGFVYIKNGSAEYFTQSSTSYTLPNSGATRIIMMGGGGSGGNNASANNMSSGGGGAGMIQTYDIIATSGMTANITVGNGGSAPILLNGNGFRFNVYTSGYFNDDPSWFASQIPSSSGYVTDMSNIGTSTNGIVPTNDSWSYYSVEWFGYFRAPTTGTYNFYTASDDGSYLWIGASAASGYTTANCLVNNGGGHGVQEVGGSINLVAGTYYPLRIQFGEMGGGDNCMVSFTGPGISRTYNFNTYVSPSVVTDGEQTSVVINGITYTANGGGNGATTQSGGAGSSSGGSGTTNGVGATNGYSGGNGPTGQGTAIYTTISASSNYTILFASLAGVTASSLFVIGASTASSTFNVSGESTLLGNTTAVARLNVSGETTLLGNTTLMSQLNVSGMTTLLGNTTAVGRFNVSGESTLLGNTTLVSQLNVSGESTLLGNTTAVARFNVSGESTLLGNTTLVSQLNVSGMTTLLGNTTAVARFNVSGESTLLGNITAVSCFNVSGESTLLGNTTLVSQLNVSGESTLLGNMTAVARFNVSGESTLLGNVTLVSQLNVSGETTLLGNTTAVARLNVSGESTLLGNATLMSQLNVSGKTTLLGNTTAVARFNVSGESSLLGDVTAVARFNVSGESTLLGDVTAVARFNVSGESTLLGNMTAVARFNVSGESTLLGNTTLVSQLNVSGETTLLGNTTLVSQLNVSGMTTLLGNTTAVARFNVSGESTLLGNTTLVSQLNVSGESTLFGNVTLVSQLNVSGESTLLGNTTAVARFNVSGESTLLGNATAMARFNVSGESTLLGNATLVSQLNVSGMTTLLGNTTAVARFNVSGESTLLGNTTLVSQLNVSGESTLLGNTTAVARFNVSGESTLLGNTTIVSQLNVSGESTLLGNTTAVARFNVSGESTLLGNTTIVSQLNVSGETTLFGNMTAVGTLNVSGKTTLLGDVTAVANLNISGNTFLNGTLSMGGNMVLFSNMSVSGSSSASGPVTQSSTLNVSGKTTLQGDVTMLSQLNLVGDITYSGNMIKNGFTMMSWFDNTIPSQPGTTIITPNAAQNYYGCYIDVNFSSSKVYSYVMQSNFGGDIIKWTIAGSNDRTTWYLLSNEESNTGINYSSTTQFKDTPFTYVRFIVRKIDFHYNVLCQRFCLYDQNGNKINISLYDASSWAASRGIVYYQGSWSNPVNSDTANNMYLGSNDYDTYNNGWDGSYTGSQYTAIIPSATISTSAPTPIQPRMYNLAEIGIGISAPSNMLSVSGTTLLNGAVTMTTTLNVSGETTLLGNATAVGRLNVSGESTLLGNTTAMARFNVSGESTLLGNTTLVSQLNVSGESTLLGNMTAVARFNVSGESTLLGNMTAVARLNVSGESTLLGNTTAVARLNVSGESTLLGNTTAVARFNVSGETTLLGNTTLLSQLNVSGKTTLEGAITANSTVNINDTMTVLKKVQVYTFSAGNGGTAGTNYYAGGGGAGGVIVRQNGSIINPTSIATDGVDSSTSDGGNAGVGFGAGGGGGSANVVTVSGSTTAVAGEWIQFDLGSAKVIQTYGLGNWGMDKEIGTWTLAGSTDNSTWYTIDSQVQVTPAHYAFTTYTSAGAYATSSFRYIRLIVQGLKQQPYYYGSTLQFTFYLRDSANNFLQTSPSNTATYSENLGNSTGYFYMSSSTSDTYPNSPGAGPSGPGYYYATNNTYTGPVSTSIYSSGSSSTTITSLAGGSGANGFVYIKNGEIEYFTQASTSYILPNSGATKIIIMGGGGSGGNNSSANNMSSGGGGAGYIQIYDIIATSGMTANITVGNGGTAPSLVSGNGFRFNVYTSGYFNDDPSWFATQTPSSTGYATDMSSIGASTNSIVPNNSSWSSYSVEWFGYFRAPSTGTYTFYTNSDDASYLWIGTNALSGFTTANCLVNNGGGHGMQEVSGAINLTAGTYYPIRVQYGEGGGGDNCIVSFAGPGISKTTNFNTYVSPSIVTDGDQSSVVINSITYTANGGSNGATTQTGGAGSSSGGSGTTNGTGATNGYSGGNGSSGQGTAIFNTITTGFGNSTVLFASLEGVTASSLFVIGASTASSTLNVSGESTLLGNTTAMARLNVSGESTLLGNMTAVARLNVSGESTLLGNTTLVSQLNVSGMTTLLGNTTAVARFNVSGESTLLGNMTAVARLNVSGESTLLGNTTLVSRFNVSGMTTLLGNTTAVARFNVSGESTLLGNTTLVSQLNVSGESTLLGNTTLVSQLNVSGMTSLLGNTTLVSQLNVSGMTTLQGNTTLMSQLNVSGESTLLGNTTLVSQLNVSGESTLLGNTTLVSRFNVSGESTLLGNMTAVSYFNVSGETTLLGNTTLVSQLNVSGMTTLLGNTTLVSQLNVSGKTTLLDSVTAVNTLNVSGESTLLGNMTAVARFNVSGESTLLGNATLVSQLNVSGNTTLQGNTTAVARFNVSGESTLLGNATLVSQLNVSGMTTLLGNTTAVARLNVSGESTLLGNTTLVSQLNVSGMTTLQGNTTAVAQFNVSGESTLLGNVTLVSQLNVSGMTTLQGNTTAMAQFNVSGESTLLGNVTLVSQLNVSGMTNLLGNTTAVARFNVSGESTLLGNTTLVSQLNVSGMSTFLGSVTAMNTLNVSGMSTFLGSVTAMNTLNVSGMTTMQGAVTAMNTLNVSGMTTLQGNTTAVARFNVSGESTLLGNTTLVSRFNVSGESTLLGNTTLVSQLNVSGMTTMQGAVTAMNTLNVSGQTTMQGATTMLATLNVSGNTTLLGPMTATSTINVSGKSTMQGDITGLASLNISGVSILYGATTLGSTISVMGDTRVNTIRPYADTITGPSSVNETINIIGHYINIGNSNSVINIAGTTTSVFTNQIVVEDPLIVINSNAAPVYNVLGNDSGIEISAISTVGYLKTNADATKFSLKAPQSTDVGYIVTKDNNDNLIITGTTTMKNSTTMLSSLNISGQTVLLGNITAVAQLNISGTTTQQGATTLLSTLNVSGQTNLLGNVTMVSAVNISGVTTHQGATTILSTLNISGVVTIGTAPSDLTTALTVNNNIKLLGYGTITAATTSVSTITENTATTQTSRYMGSIPLPAGFVDGSAISVVMTGTRGPGYGYIEGGSYIEDTSNTTRFIQLSYGYAGVSGTAVITGTATTPLTASMFPLKVYKYAAYPGWYVYDMTLNVTLTYNTTSTGISSSFQQIATNGAYNVYDNINAASRMYIDQYGDFGINNSSPVYTLDVGSYYDTVFNIAKLNATDRSYMSYSVSPGDITGQVSYARTFGGVGTASQNGYFAIDLLNGGTFASSLDITTSQMYMTTSQTWFKTKVGAGNMTSSGANKVLVSDASGYMVPSGITTTTLNYLDATSSVQTQFNALANTVTNLSSFKNPTTALSSFNVSGNTTLQGPITGLSSLNISGNTSLQGTAYIGNTLSTGNKIYSYSGAGVGNLKLTTTGNQAGDQWWIGFGHGGDASDSNDRARIGVDIKAGGAGRLFFNTGWPQTERMRLDENGYLGIGTNNPQTLVDINNSSNPKIYLTSSGSRAFLSGMSGYLDLGNDSGTGSIIRFMPNGSESIRIANNGNMGIGTTTPNAPLQFANTTVNRKIVMWDTLNNDNQYYGFGINNSILRYQVDTTAANHVFYAAVNSTTSNELMRIQGNGIVGIGTSAPGSSYSSTIPNAKLSLLSGTAGSDGGKSRLSIGGDNSHYAAIEGAHVSGGTSTLALMTAASAGVNSSNPSTRLFIDGPGNVGIGTTSMSALLHVSGTTIMSGASTHGSTLNVMGVATINNTTNISGNVNVTGGTIFNNPAADTWQTNVTLNNNSSIASYQLLVGGSGNGSGSAGVGGFAIHGGVSGSYGFKFNINSNGNVGINRTDPQARLHVNGTSIMDGATTATSTLNVTGNVGIGSNVSYPSQTKVQITGVNGGASIPQQLAIADSSNINQQLLIGTASAGYSSIQSILQGSAMNNLSLNPAGGNIGINTTTPSTILTVNASGVGFRQTDNNVSVDIYTGSDGTLTAAQMGTSSNNPLAFYTNNSAAQVLLDTTGNVGIGNNAPAARLHVSGTTIIGGAMTANSSMTIIGASTYISTLNISGTSYFNNNITLNQLSSSNVIPSLLFSKLSDDSSGNGLGFYYHTNSAGNRQLCMVDTSYATKNSTNNMIRFSNYTGITGFYMDSISTNGGTFRPFNIGGNPLILQHPTIHPGYNVGISTSAPAATLHVSGTTILEGALTTNSTLLIKSAMTALSTVNISGQTVISGSVGIGVTPVSAALHINNNVIRMGTIYEQLNVYYPEQIQWGNIGGMGYSNITAGINGIGGPFGCGGILNLTTRLGNNTTYNGMYINNGNVGIGISSPSTMFHVNGSSLLQGTATVTSTLTVSGAMTSNSTLNVAGNTFVAGTMSIGTTSNSHPLTINSSNASKVGLIEPSTGTNYIAFNSNSLARGYVGLENSIGTGLFGSNSGYGMSLGTNVNGGVLAFATNNVIRTTIDTAGNMGVNTSAPAAKFHVNGTTILQGATTVSSTLNVSGNVTVNSTLSVVSLDSSTAVTTLLNFKNTSGFGIYADSRSIGSRGNTLDFKTYDYNINNSVTTRTLLTMRPEGTIGIGTLTPLQMLHVDGGNIGINSKDEVIGKSALYFYNNPYMTSGNVAAKVGIITEAINNYTRANLHFCVNNTQDLTTSATIADARMTINSDTGFVGIGTTYPSSYLTVTGGNPSTDTSTSPFTAEFNGSGAFDACTVVRVLNDASQYGRAQLKIVSRFENNNDGWHLTGGRSNIQFESQVSQSSTITTNFALQNYGVSRFGILSSYNISSPALAITSNNNYVGIGTDTPAASLHVSGTTLIANAMTAASTLNVMGSTVLMNTLNMGTSNKKGLIQSYNASTTSQFHMTLTGAEYYQPGSWTSTDGIGLTAGVNRPNNRQLWVMDTALTANTTNSAVRIVPQLGYIDAVSTDGSMSKMLTVGNSIGVVLNGPTTAVSSINVAGTLNLSSGINMTGIPNTTSNNNYVLTYNNSTGAIGYNGFYVTQLFNSQSNSWSGGVTSSNVTLGANSKMIQGTVTYYVTAVILAQFSLIFTPVGGGTAYTFNFNKFFNNTYTHAEHTFTLALTNAQLPSGTYTCQAIKSGANSGNMASDTNDQIMIAITNYPN